MQLGENVADVVAHSFRAERELLRNCIVVQALRHQAQHIALALGQFGEGRDELSRPGAKEAHHTRGDRRAENRIAAPNRQDRAGDVVVIHILEHIATRARTHRRKDRIVVLKHRHHQHARLGLRRDNRAHSRKPVAARHLQIHQHHVGMQFRSQPHRVGTIRRLAKHAHLRHGRQQCAQALAEEWVVVCYEDT